MSRIRRTIIESPFAGDTARNIAYAKRCLNDSILRGEAPIAFHLLLPEVLVDTRVIERDVGLRLSQVWYSAADCCAVYTDHGISPGMRVGIRAAKKFGLIITYRKILT